MKFSVFTASTPEWSPQEAVTELAAQGWDGIEWRVVDQPPADPATGAPGFWSGNRATWPLSGLESSIPAIAKLTADAGLEFSALGGYARCDDHANVERILAATAALGARRARVTMFPQSAGNYRDLFARARDDLEWVADRAASHGVQALVELHHETITSSASAALRLVDGLDPARVGVIHDLGNLLIEGNETHRSAFELLGPYLAHVHVKNAVWRADEPDDDGVVGWVHEWETLRRGQGDVERYLDDLVAVGYDGWITVEDFSTALPLADRTRDNLGYLKGALARASAAHRVER